MKVAVLGVTGLVGRTMLKVLEERNFPVSELIPAASPASEGKMVLWRGKECRVLTAQQALDAGPQIALFSAGGTASREWAPRFAAAGCYVIDNSSAWRMQHDIPLVVPEVNPHTISETPGIIANPNCSTIQLVVALHPLQRKYGIERLVISTYQSVSGTGQKALQQMDGERKGENPPRVYPYPIDLNCIPHGGDFLDDGYTTEEMKLVHETRKILGDEHIRITATVVRVPVRYAHSESVNVRLRHEFELSDIKKLLQHAPGVKVVDEPAEAAYPVPLQAAGQDEVWVGRLRRDYSEQNSLNMWVVADNLRKGAATNAVQIAEILAARMQG